MNSLINFAKQISIKSLILRMLIGACIGLLIIFLFLINVDNPKPEWGTYWRIKPLIITPLVSAIGFLSFFFKEYLNPESYLSKLFVFIISLIAFIISLWMGIVLGLDGTLWN